MQVIEDEAKTILEKEIDSVSCPVIISSMRELLDNKDISGRIRSFLYGIQEQAMCVTDVCDGSFIFLNSDRTKDNIRRLFDFIHEKGHLVCAEKSCSCYLNNDHVMGEFHAIKYQSDWLQKIQCSLILKEEMIQKFLNYLKRTINLSKEELCFYNDHKKASEKYIESQEFIELEQYVKTYGFIGELFPALKSEVLQQKNERSY